MEEKQKMKGKLITFEGPEGSGKSTQSKLLCEYLRGKSIPFIYTREPGGTEIGEEIRQLLLDPENVSMTQECECLLYLAARAQLVEELIRPALRDGKVVILDRFTDSTIAYQGYGHNLDIDFIKGLTDFIAKGIRPDLTILLDVETKEGLKRSLGSHRKDRMEARGVGYHRKVREGYLELAKDEPDRIKVISTKSSVDKAQRLIREEVEKFLSKR